MVTTLRCHGAGYPSGVLNHGGRTVQKKAGVWFPPWGTLGSDLDEKNQLENHGRVKGRQRRLEDLSGSFWLQNSSHPQERFHWGFGTQHGCHQHQSQNHLLTIIVNKISIY